MKIFVAMDSFKGSFTSQEALLEIKKALPAEEVWGMPVSDGGEGLLESIAAVKMLKRVVQEVEGPRGQKVSAYYLYDEQEKCAYIEVAQAAGLNLGVVGPESNPCKFTSYGTGEQIKDALARGAKKIVTGLGGSATTDGGIGVLAALGVRFFDETGQVLAPNKANLQTAFSFDAASLTNRAAQVDWQIIADVTNPLLGPEGAVAVFGPQKGITGDMQPQHEEQMAYFAKSAAWQLGKDMSRAAGSGAAGGLGFALMTFCGATCQNGVAFLETHMHLSEEIAKADVVFTGEGRFDQQSLKGKLPIGIARLAKTQQVPVILFCGQSLWEEVSLPSENILAIVPITPGPCTLTDALTQGTQNLRRAVQRAVCQLRFYSADKTPK